MGAIVIKSDTKSNKILKALAEKLGGQTITIDDEQYEDIALGLLMEKEKTNTLVSREIVMEKLNSK